MAISASLALGIFTIVLQLFYLQRPLAEPLYCSLVWALATGLLLLVARCIQSWCFARCAAAGYLTRNIAVVGADFAGRADAINERILGVYDDAPPRGRGLRHAPDGNIDDLLAQCRRQRVDAILITAASAAHGRLAHLQRRLNVTVADLYLAADFVGAASGCTSLANTPALLLQRRPLQGWDAIRKRCFDTVLAALLLALLAPTLGLIALIIKLDSPGPVLFRQPRLGFNNTLFRIYKFRTMHHHMTDLHAERQTTRHDTRITRVGKWLRRLSLDELPQLVNVLNGDMSLVGPRPHALNTKAGEHRYTDSVENYALRHRVKPGITGWAQVNGWRGETVTLEQIEQRVACDLHYIDNWTLAFDVRILLLTVLRGFTSAQAY